MCDVTQNLNETESETFFRYQIFPIPNPILFPIPNFFDTESETTKKMEKFRNREVSKPKRHTLFIRKLDHYKGKVVNQGMWQVQLVRTTET